ncbi:MAG: hypothetical protein HKM95_05135 [Inquilinus sp.]|nr:hypothetical protein [Inquilinus sp.]
MRRLWAATAVTLLLAAPAAWGAALPDAFYGRWIGSGLAEGIDTRALELSPRDLDVSIEPDDDGFRVQWTTVIREAASPAANTRERAASLTFQPTDRPGVFSAKESGNPQDGGVLSWARLAGDTLSVFQMAMTDRGGFAFTAYARTLTDTGMALEFSRFTDGVPERRATGRLVRMER